MSAAISTPSRSFAGQRALGWGLGVVFGICCLRLGLFVGHYAVDLPCADQWDYLNPLFRQSSLLDSFLYQHGPHRLGLGGIVDRVLYPLSSWDMRAVSWFCAVTLVLSAGLALALVYRVRGELRWRDSLIPLAFINPLHWEGMLLTPGATASFLPLLLLMLTAHAWLLRNEIVRGLSLALLLSVSLFTGYGFCHALAGAGLVMLELVSARRPDLKGRLPGLALLGLAFLCLVRTQAWVSAVSAWRFPVPEWWNYSSFIILMHGRLLGSDYFSTTAFLSGGLLTMALTWILVRSLARLLKERSCSPADRAILWLVTCALSYAVLVAVGRLPTGLQAAFVWRYSTLLLPGLVALLLIEQAMPGLQVNYSRMLSALLILAGLRMWFDFSHERFGAINLEGKSRWVGSYLQHHNIARANAESDCIIYPPDPTSPLIAAKLEWLEQRKPSFFAHPEDYPPARAIESKRILEETVNQ